MRIDVDRVFEYAAKHARVQSARPGPPVPFHLNAIQHDYVSRSQAMRGLCHSDYAVKPRQVGMSTLQLVYISCCCVLYPGFSAIWISQDEENARTIRGKFRIIYRSILESVGSGVSKKDVLVDNAFEWQLANGSMIIFTYAGETGKKLENVGRGSTVHYAVFTEVGYWADADKVYRSVRPALEKSGASIAYDSTPNGTFGRGAFYYQRVQKVRSNRMPGTVYFWPWWKDDNYRALAPPHEAAQILSTLSLRESQLMEQEGLTVHHIKWRRLRIEDLGSTEDFLETYPEVFEQAWKRGGKSVFDKRVLRDIELRIVTTPEEAAPLSAEEVAEALPEELWAEGGDYTEDALFAAAPMEESGGYEQVTSRFWALPDLEGCGPYAMGVDCSQGIYPDGDPQSATLVDKNGKVVWLLRCWLPIIHFSALIQRVATWFRALIDIEDKSTGSDVDRYLREEIGDKERARWNAHSILAQPYAARLVPMSTRTRPLHIQILLAYLNGRQIDVNDVLILREMHAFVRNQNTGKVEAMEGETDDVLMSLSIALRLREELLTTSRAQEFYARLRDSPDQPQRDGWADRYRYLPQEGVRESGENRATGARQRTPQHAPQPFGQRAKQNKRSLLGRLLL